MCCQVQHHEFIKWAENLVTSIKRHIFYFTCLSIFIDFIFLVEIIVLKLRIMLLLLLFLGPPPLPFSPPNLQIMIWENFPFLSPYRICKVEA